MEELKACPFCGSKDVNIEHDPITGTYVVRCRACQCVVWQYYAFEEEAVAAWNKRADDRPRGQWMYADDEHYTSEYKCSKCGAVHEFEWYAKLDDFYSNFCGNCGADMRKDG